MANRDDFILARKSIAANQSDSKLGKGEIGDILQRLVVSVSTAATSAVSIKDSAGGSAVPIVPVNTPVGVYSVELGIAAKGSSGAQGWHITTGAGVSVVAVGDFKE